MRVKSLFLQNFRNFSQKSFEFSSRLSLIVGPNASGKTNLLEAIYLLAAGKSFRAKKEEEMIHYGEEIARVVGLVDTTTTLKILLVSGQISKGKGVQKKYFVNEVNKRQREFVGQLKVVLFRPEDLEIVIDSPAGRRRYLDGVLEQVDSDYRRASLSYQKGLRQRNKILEANRLRHPPMSQAVLKRRLYFWDRLLIENGTIINQKRKEYLDFINRYWQERQKEMGIKLTVEYLANLISPEKLSRYQKKEFLWGMTLVGPHRDEVKFKVKNLKSKIGCDLSIYGSRGEQRLAVFYLKLAELEFVCQQSGEKPVLLLDDVFSELDRKHRQQLWQVIPQYQTIVTTTELHRSEPLGGEKVKIIRLETKS